MATRRPPRPPKTSPEHLGTTRRAPRGSRRRLQGPLVSLRQPEGPNRFPEVENVNRCQPPRGTVPKPDPRRDSAQKCTKHGTTKNCQKRKRDVKTQRNNRNCLNISVFMGTVVPPKVAWVNLPRKIIQKQLVFNAFLKTKESSQPPVTLAVWSPGHALLVKDLKT